MKESGSDALADGLERGGPRLDLTRYVPALLTFIASKMSSSASAAYQKRFGVNVTEWRIMALLAIEPGIPAVRICRVIGFDKGPVSRTLAGMATRELITMTPDTEDARRMRIRLSARGEALHDEIIVVAMEREQRLLAPLTPGERLELIRLLNRLHAALPS